MPRTGGVYSPPAGTKGVSGTTIQSSPYNTFIDDLTADANAARPITAGGTGATSASAARAALGLGTAATQNTGTSGATVPLLNGANTWSTKQTFPAIDIVGTTPTLAFTDTDTGADSFVSASNSSGSVVISADANNEVSSSQIFFVIDGTTTGTLSTNGTFSLTGSTPILSLTDTDTNADCIVTASGATGSLGISADVNNEAANSQIIFAVDGATKATIDAAGALTSLGEIQITSASPILRFTDTDTNADSHITASSSTGSLGISADVNNESSGSLISFSVDGVTRATIDNQGDLNVGTWASNGATIGWTYDVSAGIVRSSQSTASSAFHYAFYNTNTLVGGISTSGTATTYAVSSDYRRKPVVEPLTGFWERINATKPRRFQWDSGQWDTGFIAHEFAAAYPAAVSGEKDAVDDDGNPVYQLMQASTSQVMADILAALKDINERLKTIEEAAA
uniref:tail fiber domain-containing protein n=1 Tax=Ensifer adhaerens TaxID=106592 RepID=UPI003F492369